MAEIFKEDNVTIIKEEAKPEVKAKAFKAEPTVAKNTVKVDGKELIDTIFSYENTGLNVLGETDGAICKFCGVKTSYSNRHICPACFAKRKHEILEALKTKVKGSIDLE